MLTTFLQGYAHSFAFWNILRCLLAVNTIMQNINYLSMCLLSKPRYLMRVNSTVTQQKSHDICMQSCFLAV